MYLTVHTPTSLITTKFIKKPWVVFTLSFILHLFWDTIPHDPYLSNPKHLYIIMVLDLLLLFILLFILYKKNKIKINTLTFSAVLGGIIPDALWFLNDLTFHKIYFLKIFSYFNSEIIHKLFYQSVFLPWYWALIIQTSVFTTTLLTFLKINNSKKQKI